jgi:hypothetical protein
VTIRSARLRDRCQRSEYNEASLFSGSHEDECHDLQEQRIYAYPYADFSNDLRKKSQRSLKEQYEEALRENKVVVFVRDNVQRRLVSFSMDVE